MAAGRHTSAVVVVHVASISLLSSPMLGLEADIHVQACINLMLALLAGQSKLYVTLNFPNKLGCSDIVRRSENIFESINFFC